MEVIYWQFIYEVITSETRVWDSDLRSWISVKLATSKLVLLCMANTNKNDKDNYEIQIMIQNYEFLKRTKATHSCFQINNADVSEKCDVSVWLVQFKK